VELWDQSINEESFQLGKNLFGPKAWIAVYLFNVEVFLGKNHEKASI